MAVGDFGTAVAGAIKSRVASVNGTPADALGNVNVSAAFTPSGYDVILVAGQSNAAGFAALPSDLAATDPQNPSIFMWKNGAVEPAQDPLPGSSGIGPGFPFARWYVASGSNMGRKVMVVQTAEGGTSIVAWDPQSAGVTSWDRSLAAVNAAMAAEAGSRLVGILWVQGEADANNMPPAEYETRLDAMIAAFRAQITTGTAAPFVIGQMVPEYLPGNRALIDAVQRDTPRRVARTAYAYGPLGMAYGDGNHYSAQGARELGHRLFEAWSRVNASLPAADPAVRPVVVSHTAPADRYAVWIDVTATATPVKVWSGTAWVAASAGIPVVDTTSPTAGTLAASLLTGTGFTLTVSGASDAGGLHATPYAFSTDGSTWTAYQSSASLAVTGKTAGTAYTCQHRVRDAAGNVTSGASITVTTTAADVTAPAWTATLTNGTPTAGSVVVAASALATDAVGVTGYEVSIDTGGTWAAITPSGLDFTLTGLTASTTYSTVQLRAKDAAGNTSTPALSVPNFTTASSDVTAPAWTATLTNGTPAKTSLAVTASALATDDSGTVTYERTLDSTAGTPTWAAIVPAGSVFTLTGLTQGTVYANCALRAKDAAGNVSTPVLAVPSFTTSAGAATISDDFNRTDGAALGETSVGGKTWTNRTNTVIINGGQAKGTSGSGDNYVTCEFGQADMEASHVVNVGVSFNASPIVRASASDLSGYGLDMGNNKSLKLYWRDGAGTYTTVTTATAFNTWAPGDRIALRAVENGSGGTVVTAYVNGVSKLTYTDTNAGRPMGTYTGMRLTVNGVGFIDDWECHDPTS